MLVYITKILTGIEDTTILEVFESYQAALDSKPSSFYIQKSKCSWENRNEYIFSIHQKHVENKSKIKLIKCALCKYTYYDIDMFYYNSDLCYDCGIDSENFKEKSLEWFKKFENAMYEALR